MSAVPLLRMIPEAPAPQTLLRLDGVSLSYHTRERRIEALRPTSFDVAVGERLVLLGPSGCGKSSLLKMIGGFIKPTEGRISVAGAPVMAPGPDRMMVFQEFDQLLPWKTVRGNIMFPMLASGRFGRKEASARADAMLDRFGLGQFAHAFPHTLSGGMKQRVAIGRALLVEPAVLLMDEPFGALDALTRRQMQEELLSLWGDLRFTLIFVTHGIEEAIAVGSRVLVLAPHPGQIRAEIDVSHLDYHMRAEPSFGEAAARLERLILQPSGDRQSPSDRALLQG